MTSTALWLAALLGLVFLPVTSLGTARRIRRARIRRKLAALRDVMALADATRERVAAPPDPEARIHLDLWEQEMSQ